MDVFSFSPWQCQLFVHIRVLISNKMLFAASLCARGLKLNGKLSQTGYSCYSAREETVVKWTSVHMKMLPIHFLNGFWFAVEIGQPDTDLSSWVGLFTSSLMLLDIAAVFLRQLFLKLISQSLQEKGVGEAGVWRGNMVRGGNYEIWRRGRQALWHSHLLVLFCDV